MGLEETYPETLEVFDENDEKKTYGLLTLYERTTSNRSSVENFWEWKQGPDGDDGGPCRWSPQVIVLYSAKTDPPDFVWAITNRRWERSSPSRKSRPWFLVDDKIRVTNEDKPPYPAHKARPKR